MKKTKTAFPHFATEKPYKPAPHPQQHRLVEYRSIPSLMFGKIVESKI